MLQLAQIDAPKTAAMVQAIGSVAAIIVSVALALWIPRREARQRAIKYRKAWVELLDYIANEMVESMFHVEIGQNDETRLLPEMFRVLEQQVSLFPIHELDDPKAYGDLAHVRQALVVLVEDLNQLIGRRRPVWDRLRGLTHNVWQAAEWGRARYGWPEKPNPAPNRVYGSDPRWTPTFTWDEDGNPTLRPEIRHAIGSVAPPP